MCIGVVGVVGAGLMGHGIAQVFLEDGRFDVCVYDAAPGLIETVQERIASNLKALGRPAVSFARLKLSDDISEALSGCQIVFEAVPEKLEVKHHVMRQIEAVVSGECIIASNTSVIPIGHIGEAVSKKDRLVGTHWWNPPFLIPLVEVVQATATDQQVVERTISLLESVGKVAVHVKKDVPGFVGNRLQHALWREAIALVSQGICDARTVDLVVKNSFGLRLPVLGPLENADLVGLDLTQDIHAVILPTLDSTSWPNRIVTNSVRDGNLGMKSGKGFYEWTHSSAQGVREQLLAYLAAALKERGGAQA
ncbi:3-hydroxyacyl-CoA dehydrogenase family protein [Cupriavidus basilensis]